MSIVLLQKQFLRTPSYRYLAILAALFIHFLAFSIAHGSSKIESNQWAISKIHLTNQIQIPKSVKSNRAKIPVAVIDTGLDINHPFLKNSLWTNPREIPDNNIDDDSNGYIDDIHGWNFVDNSNNLQDLHGHGTHISGIIHQVSPMTSLVILKYFSSELTPEENLKNSTEAFRYAIKMKIPIINFSGGGPGYSQTESSVLKTADLENILVVAAAGNEGSNSDFNRFYPANYGFKNILSVTAVNHVDRLPAYANYGKNTVDLASPGDHILSSVPMGGFEEMSGTSQATAFASGVAALILERAEKKWTPAQLIEHLKLSGTKSDKLIGKMKSPVILNARQALSMILPSR